MIRICMKTCPGRALSSRVLFFLVAALAPMAACSRKEKDSATNPPVASEPPVVTAHAASASPSAAGLSVDAGAPPSHTPKTHARVLHTGDSMVGGGLSRALGPKIEAAGVKYLRDVIESGTIHDFAQTDHLPKLLASFKPDLILLTLGANHVPHSLDPEKEIGPFLPKLLKRVSGIDCYWIAPPIWKPSQAKFNQWLSEHVAPCRFYDASSLEIARRPDKVHPNEKGGEVWADDLWKFMKGDGAFFDPIPGAAAP
jgi:lysophospholipase L1-like esterase